MKPMPTNRKAKPPQPLSWPQFGSAQITSSPFSMAWARMRMGSDSPQDAADAVMAEVGALGGSGGVIVVTPRGEGVYSFNTPGMYRGEASPAGRSVAIYGDEE